MNKKYNCIALFLLCFVYNISAQCNLDAVVNNEIPACANQNTGAVDITILNAAFPVDIAYNNTTLRATSNIVRLTDLFGNVTYDVVLTDANSCQFTFSVSVLESTSVTISGGTGDVSCAGSNDGFIDMVASGGQGDYQYTWSHDPTISSPALSGLSAGDYTVTVTDRAGCSSVQTFIVNEPSQIDIIVVSVTSPNCFGEATGSIEVGVQGGTPPYTYDWSNAGNGNTPIVVGLPAGSYIVTVTDNNGCTESVVATVNEPPPFDVTLTWTGTCGSDCTGSVDLTVSGATPPYAFAWSNGATTQDLTNLCAGNPVVTITDANGCITLNEAIIEQTPADSIGIVLDASVLSSCENDCAGTLNVRGVCGTPPYTYDWSDDNYDGQNRLSGLCTGTYVVAVTDATGKSTIRSYTIRALDPIELTSTVQQITCFEGGDGSITLQASGGAFGYTYLWSNLSTTRNLNALLAGDYTVTVTDRVGCTAEETFTITEPAEMTATISVLIDSCQTPLELTGSATGGTGSYTYSWAVFNGVFMMDQTIAYQGDGQYLLIVTDENGCTASDMIDVSSRFDLQLTSTAANCDSLGGSATASVLTTISNPMYTWSNGMTGPTIGNLSPGGYGVTVVDEDGCRDNGSIVVELDSSCYVLIEGYVYLDNDMDCQADNGQGINNVLVQLSDGSSTFTNSIGYYAFRSLPGNYVIDAMPDTARYELTCGNSLTIDASQSGSAYVDNDFYVKIKPRIDVAVKVRKPTPRPGFTNFVTICVMNYSDAPITTTATFVYDSLQTYVSNNFDQFLLSHDPVTRTLIWEFPDQPVGRINVIQVAMRTMVDAALGATVGYDFTVEPIVGDVKPINNKIYCTRIVRGSYDPNDKTPSPMGEGQIGLLPFGQEELGFLVRFQNTGTDTAFTVVIRDTLDQSIDLDQIVPGPSSHPYELSVLGDNVLEFTFNDILLPDSTTNLIASNGFVFYDVYLSKDLPIGTTINNSAAIYFDYNQPIITNTTVNTIAGPDLFSEITLQGCGSVAFDGELYTSDTSLVTVYDLPYYDSIVTTVVKVLDVYSTTIDTTLEDGNVYNGIEYTVDTVLVDVFAASNGCDSTINTNITVNTVGVNDLSLIVDVDIQPNPTSGFSQLVIESQENKVVELQITNLHGQVIQTLSIDLFKGKGSTIPIDLSDFSFGVYLINLRSDQAVWSGKLIRF